MPTVIQDGTLNFGGYAVSVTPPAGGDAVTVIMGGTLNVPTKTVTSTDQDDLPRAQRSYSDFVTGSAECQITGTSPIAIGATFTENFANTGSRDYYVDNASPVFNIGAEQKQNITFRAVVGGSAPTVTVT